MLAQGIAEASVSSTMGRSQGSIVAPPQGAGRASLPAADVGYQPDDEFVICGELGRGGMATVWLAEQSALGREVAIKRISIAEAETELLLLREAVITGQLEHPNIVPVHLLVVDDQGPAVVMKRLSGKTWDTLVQEAETPLERHLEIAVQVTHALEFAHSRGVLHRDVKPANVMIGDFGEVYLLDWGVARRVSDPPSDVIVGTPRYMAPEMAEGLADARTDVFLLGAAIHEALTRKPRHDGDDAVTVLYAAMYVEPYAYGEEVPEELAGILNRACARDPKQRFTDARVLREALITFREHRAAHALNDTALERLEELARVVDVPDASYAEVQRLFSVARFAFDAAQRVWPESQEAEQGLERCLDLMIDYELRMKHPDAAAALLASRPGEDPSRAEVIEALRRALDHEQERLLAIARDRDPSVGAPSRTRAYLTMGLATLLMTLALFVQRLFFPGFQPSTLRLMLVGAAVLIVMLVIVRYWRRHSDWNFINRRIADVTVATLAVSFANRLSGFMTGEDAARVLIGDALILGLGGSLLSAYHRAGPWLAAMSFAVAMLGSLWPAFIDDMFIGLSLFVPAALLWWRSSAGNFGTAQPTEAAAELSSRERTLHERR
jgi:serine/threonine-protein kinase